MNTEAVHHGSSADGLGAATLVHAFLGRVRNAPDEVAYATKRLGLWEESTWADLHREVAQATAALRGLGLHRGDVVAVMGDARSEFTTTMLACQFLGLRCAALYPATVASELAALVSTVRPKAFIGEDSEDIDKLQGAGAEGIDHVVVLEPRGAPPSGVRAWQEVLDNGGPALDLDTLVDDVGPWDTAHVALSSGTADRARPAVVTHENVMSAWTGACSVLPPIDDRDRVIADAPLSHPAGLVTGLVLPVITGCVPFFVEDPLQVVVAAKEVQPTISFGTPRRWLVLWRQVSAGVEESSRLKRRLFRLAANARGSRIGSLAAVMVHRPLLRKIGASRLRVCVVGWAPLPTGLIEFWRGLGIEMRELYGLSETGGVATVGAGPAEQSGVLGVSIPGMDLRLAEDGEILLRGPQVSVEYVDGRDVRQPAVDADGWLHTHDVARSRPDGSIGLLGRREGLLVLGDGSTVHAEQLESHLRTSPYIDQAIVFAASGAQPAAVVDLDMRNVARWARQHSVIFTAPDELPTRDEVQQLIHDELERIGPDARADGLPRLAHIDISPAPLSLAELTPTRRIRGQHRRALSEAGLGAGLGTSLRP